MGREGGGRGVCLDGVFHHYERGEGHNNGGFFTQTRKTGFAETSKLLSFFPDRANEPMSIFFEKLLE